MTKVIMVQGTMSSAGKSLLVAGLCRIFRQDGYRVAPFKSQNMALNSFITSEGLEMGRAQVMQAEAAGIEPMVCMNLILLKPTNHTGSQVIVNGKVIGNMSAKDYFSYKKNLIPDIKVAFKKLEEVADIIVIEGAGSPAEINLKENDIVNMGMAAMVDAPVLLVGDIDRGGVFAQLLGTLMLLEPDERDRVKGLVINKFRGDASILDSGIKMLEEKGGVPVAGLIPYMDLCLDDEDSLTGRFNNTATGLIVILPGSKNTMGDLKWLRTSGLEAAIVKLSEDIPVIGICGGYQMLGNYISDPDSVEEGGSIKGMNLLPVSTVLKNEKTRLQTKGAFDQITGIFEELSGFEYEGYEIHMGLTSYDDEGNKPVNNNIINQCNVYGSYIHGLFDHGKIASTIISCIAKKKGIDINSLEEVDYKAFKESQYNKLADTMRLYLDMEKIYGILNESAI